jgi:type IV pilus assembly protein PilO
MKIDLKNPNHQRALLSFLGVALVAYLYYFAPFVPANYQARAKRLTELKDKYERLSSDLTKARQAVASLDRLEAQSKKLHERWAIVREELPDQREVPSLLRRITLAGSQAGVHFLLFKPDAPAPNEYYTDNPVQISVVGGYHQVATFLSEVAGLSRLVNSHNLNLTNVAPATNNKTANNEDQTTQASVIASAYTLGGNEPKNSSKAAPSKGSKGASPNANQSLAKVAP